MPVEGPVLSQYGESREGGALAVEEVQGGPSSVPCIRLGAKRTYVNTQLDEPVGRDPSH